jgi:hypothetical protein
VLPGKTYRLSDVIGILLRQRLWVVLPLGIGLTAASTPGTVVMGASGGLIVGLLLVAVLEYRDARLSREEDVLRALALPVLGVIPLMAAKRDRQTRRYLRLSADIAVIAFALFAMVRAIWRMRSGGA